MMNEIIKFEKRQQADPAPAGITVEGDIDLKAIDKALKPLEQDLDALMRMNEEIERKIA